MIKTFQKEGGQDGVDDPNSVEVTPAVGIKVAVFKVKVAQGDNRRVIGKIGLTATALRELLLSIGTRAGRRFFMEVVEA